MWQIVLFSGGSAAGTGRGKQDQREKAKRRREATCAKMADIKDLERVRRALRAGAQAVQVETRAHAARCTQQ